MAGTTIRLIDNIGRRQAKNRVFVWVIILLTAITVSPIILILSKLIAKGYRQINLAFFTERAPDTFEAMTAVANNTVIPGGIVNGITGTLLIVGLAAVIAIPLGILIGIFLFEHPKSWYAAIVRNLTDILQGVPSIVLGLIALAKAIRG